MTKLEVVERDEDGEASVEVARSEAGTQEQSASGEVEEVEVEEEPKTRTVEDGDARVVPAVLEQSDAQS